jgi:predicted acetyltransferase
MIQFGEDKYIPALKAMWQLCFPLDAVSFIDFYFDKVYKHEEALIYVEKNQPVAFLHMIPYSLKIGATIYAAGYISGAMTHPEYRKKGYMGKLLNASFDVMQQKGYSYTFLIPQEEWLVGFYERFGYQSFVSPSLKDFKNFKVFKSYAEHTQFLATLPNAVLKSEEQFANIVADSLSEGGEIIDAKEKRGMIKKINPFAETITNLYMGRMLD